VNTGRRFGCPPDGGFDDCPLPSGALHVGKSTRLRNPQTPSTCLLRPCERAAAANERFNRIAGMLSVRREAGGEAMTMADWTPTVDVVEVDKVE
jgi:hypothetical protein